MKGQARTVALVLLCVIAAVAAQTQFNMGGVGATNFDTESYLPQAESMGSNWQEINCTDLTQSEVADLLVEADSLGIRVFLDYAGLGNGRPNITAIAASNSGDMILNYWREGRVQQ